MTPPGRSGTTAAVFLGGGAAFVVGERLVEAIRPGVLLDPDPGWIIARFLLWILLATAVATAGGLAAAGFLSWSRSRLGRVGPGPLSLPPRTIVVVGAVALVAGLLLRFLWIDTLPIPFLEDEVNLIGPALGL
ncbi:MAG TPA: hypothetical protein VFW15_13925, partial [Thermoanaerobaculia bacterium]|nr:hypothetical protein [Thermoanaerobaculia bacterium]